MVHPQVRSHKPEMDLAQGVPVRPVRTLRRPRKDSAGETEVGRKYIGYDCSPANLPGSATNPPYTVRSINISADVSRFLLVLSRNIVRQLFYTSPFVLVQDRKSPICMVGETVGFGSVQV